MPDHYQTDYYISSRPKKMKWKRRFKQWVRSVVFPKAQRKLDRAHNPNHAELDKTPDWFEILAFIVVLINTAVLAAADPTTTTAAEQVFDYLDYFFVFFFTLELTLRVVAFGMKGTFKSWWHITDLVVVVIGIVGLVLKSAFPQLASAVNSLRAIRTLRPLKVVASITEVQIVLQTLSRCLTLIVDIAALYLLFWLAGSSWGVSLFKGRLSYHCVREELHNATKLHETLIFTPDTLVNRTAEISIPPYIVANTTITLDAVLGLVSMMNTSDFICGGRFDSVVLGREIEWCDATTSCDPQGIEESVSVVRGFVCPYEYQCMSTMNNKFGFMNYDNFGFAMLTTQTLVTFEAWTDISLATCGATNRFAIIYSFLVVLVGALFMTNLLVAFMTMQFDVSRVDTLNARREALAARRARNRTRIRTPSLVERIRGYLDSVFLAQHIRRQLCMIWSAMDPKTRVALKRAWAEEALAALEGAAGGVGGDGGGGSLEGSRRPMSSPTGSFRGGGRPSAFANRYPNNNGGGASSPFANSLNSPSSPTLVQPLMGSPNAGNTAAIPMSPMGGGRSPRGASPHQQQQQQQQQQRGGPGGSGRRRTNSVFGRRSAIGRPIGSDKEGQPRVDQQQHEAFKFQPNSTLYEAARLWYKTDGDFSIADAVPPITRMIPNSIALRGVEPIVIHFDEIGNVVDDEATVLLFLEQLIAVCAAVTSGQWQSEGGGGGDGTNIADLLLLDDPSLFLEEDGEGNEEGGGGGGGSGDIQSGAQPSLRGVASGSGGGRSASFAVSQLQRAGRLSTSIVGGISSNLTDLTQQLVSVGTNLPGNLTAGLSRQMESLARRSDANHHHHHNSSSDYAIGGPLAGGLTMDNAIHDPSFRNFILFEADAEEAMFQIRKRKAYFKSVLNSSPSRLEMIRFSLERLLNRSAAFELATLACSCIGLLGQLVQYEGMPEVMDTVLNRYLVLACGLAFTVEWVLRFLASHPIAFFGLPTNWVTFVVLACEWASLGSGYREFTCLRSLRLVAVDSTLRFFPSIFKWYMVLKGSFQSSLVVVMLIGVDAIIVGLVGLHALGASFCNTDIEPNRDPYALEAMLVVEQPVGTTAPWSYHCAGNPRDNFDTFAEALLTAIQLIAADGWHNVMYRSMRVMDTGLKQGFFAIIFLLHYFGAVMLLVNIFIAVLVGATESLYDEVGGDGDDDGSHNPSHSSNITSAAGVTSKYGFMKELAAAENVEKSRKKEEKKERRRLRRERREAVAADAQNNANGGGGGGGDGDNDDEDDDESDDDSSDDDVEMTKMSSSPTANTASSSQKTAEERQAAAAKRTALEEKIKKADEETLNKKQQKERALMDERKARYYVARRIVEEMELRDYIDLTDRVEEADGYVRDKSDELEEALRLDMLKVQLQRPPDTIRWALQRWVRTRRVLFRISHPIVFFREVFEEFLDSSLWQFIEQMAVLTCVVMLFLDSNSMAPDVPLRQTLRTINSVLSIFFASEIFVQILARGPRRYYGSSLMINVICTLAAIAGLVEFAVYHYYLVNFVYLKTAYVLRTVKLLLRSETIALIWSSVAWALIPLRKVMVIVVIVFIGFCTTGMMLFSGKFGSCSSEGEDGEAIATKAACLAAGHDWVNPPHHFDTVQSSILTLGLVSALEGWADVMYNGIDSTYRDEAPQHNYSPAHAIYFIIFVFVGNFFLINLFGSVLIYSFEMRKSLERKQRLLMTDPLERWWSQVKCVCDSIPVEIFLDMDVDLINKMPKAIQLRLRVHRARSNRWYTRFVVFVTLLGALAGFAEYYPSPETLNTVLQYTFDVHAAIFVVDAVVAIYALGWFMYVTSSINRFELMVAVALAADVVIRRSAPAFQFGNVFRFIRLFRVIRSGQMKQRVRDLASRLGKAMSSLVVITCFLAIFILVASLIATRLFGTLSRINGGLSPYRNFENLPNAIFLASAVIVGSDWKEVMDACSVREGSGDCDPNIGECGYPVAAPILFFVYVVLGNYCLFNIFVAAIIDSFEQDILPNAVSQYDVVKFVQVWAQFDKHRTFQINSFEFYDLLQSLPDGHPFKPIAKSGDTVMHGFEYVRYSRQLRLYVNKSNKIELFDTLIELTRVNAGERYAATSHASIKGSLSRQLQFVYQAASFRRAMQASIEAKERAEEEAKEEEKRREKQRAREAAAARRRREAVEDGLDPDELPSIADDSFFPEAKGVRFHADADNKEDANATAGRKDPLTEESIPLAARAAVLRQQEEDAAAAAAAGGNDAIELEDEEEGNVSPLWMHVWAKVFARHYRANRARIAAYCARLRQVRAIRRAYVRRVQEQLKEETALREAREAAMINNGIYDPLLFSGDRGVVSQEEHPYLRAPPLTPAQARHFFSRPTTEQSFLSPTAVHRMESAPVGSPLSYWQPNSRRFLGAGAGGAPFSAAAGGGGGADLNAAQIAHLKRNVRYLSREELALLEDHLLREYAKDAGGAVGTIGGRVIRVPLGNLRTHTRTPSAGFPAYSSSSVRAGGGGGGQVAERAATYRRLALKSRHNTNHRTDKHSGGMDAGDGRDERLALGSDSSNDAALLLAVPPRPRREHHDGDGDRHVASISPDRLLDVDEDLGEVPATKTGASTSAARSREVELLPAMDPLDACLLGLGELPMMAVPPTAVAGASSVGGVSSPRRLAQTQQQQGRDGGLSASSAAVIYPSNQHSVYSGILRGDVNLRRATKGEMRQLEEELMLMVPPLAAATATAAVVPSFDSILRSTSTSPRGNEAPDAVRHRNLNSTTTGNASGSSRRAGRSMGAPTMGSSSSWDTRPHNDDPTL